VTKREKLLERIREHPRSVPPHDLWTLLEAYGFVLDRVSGSHHVYIGKVTGQGVTLVIPLHKPHIKTGYVKQALAIIDRIRAAEGEDR
jgi:predicted RNA binding protein YcfA (HicA-like mRNA interferase family)